MKILKINQLEDVPEKTRMLMKEYEEYIRCFKSSSTVYKVRRELVNLFSRQSGTGTVREATQYTEEELEEYLSECKERGLSARSYNRKVQIFREFFNYLLELGIIFQNPARKSALMKKESDKTLGVYTEEEVHGILKALPERRRGEKGFINLRDLAMAEMLYSTGMRRGELAGLDIEDVDMRSREVVVRNGKGGKERTAPVGERALNALRVYLNERIKMRTSDGALFVGMNMKRISPHTVTNCVERWKRKAGVRAYGKAHAFRHSFASHMLVNGASITAIQRILGHSNISTTTKYLHIREEDAKAVHAQSHPRSHRAKVELFEYRGMRRKTRRRS